MKKKAFSLFICLYLLVTLIIPVHPIYAKDNPPYEGLNSNGEIKLAYQMTPNGLVKLNEAQLQIIRQKYKNKMNSVSNKPEILPNTQNITPPIVQSKEPVWYDTYAESYRNATYDGPVRRVSIYQQNQTTNTSTFSLACTTTQSYSVSPSGDVDVAKAVSASIGFNVQVSYGISYSSTLTLSPGEWGWFEFMPIETYTYGLFTRTYVSPTQSSFSKYCSVITPNYVYDMNGRKQLDGVLIPRSSSTKPY